MASPAVGPIAHPPECVLPPAAVREEALYERLRALGISWHTHAHPSVFTVEEARALRGTLPGTHTKNLFLADKRGGLWLVVAREELSIDLNALSRQIGAPRFSFAKSKTMVAALGVAPGAVTPFALMNDDEHRVTAILDEGMLHNGPLNFHPLRNDRTSAIASADLVRFLRSSGHEPLIAALPEKP